MPVFLDRAEVKSKPRLITTAEAVWALGGVPAGVRDARFGREEWDGLQRGLTLLWQGDSEKAHNPRHVAWYLLAKASSRSVEGRLPPAAAGELYPIIDHLLSLQSEGEFWEDDHNRQHEVYATWISTWSLLTVLELLNRDVSDEAKSCTATIHNVIIEKLDLLSALSAEFREGLPFTRGLEQGPPRQFDESQPNPAMTAYALSLFAEADRVLGERGEASDYVANHLFLFKALKSSANYKAGVVWDSYREPILPNSSESEFEHFTTCWAIRAFWLALTSGGGVSPQVRMTWLRTMAAALAGTVRNLIVEGDDWRGQFRVDRGSPRDFSFAVSDMLGLINLFFRLYLPRNRDEEPSLQRLVALGELAELIGDAEESAEVERQFIRLNITNRELESEKGRLLDSLAVERAELVAIQSQKRGLVEDVTKLRAKSEVLRGEFRDESRRFRGGAPVAILISWLDLAAGIGFALSVLLGLAVVSVETGLFLKVALDLTQLALAALLIGGMAYELTKARGVSKTVTVIHATGIAFVGIIAMMSLLRLLMREQASVSHIVEVLTFLSTAVLIGVFGYRRHFRMWRASEELAAQRVED